MRTSFNNTNSGTVAGLTALLLFFGTTFAFAQDGTVPVEVTAEPAGAVPLPPRPPMPEGKQNPSAGYDVKKNVKRMEMQGEIKDQRGAMNDEIQGMRKDFRTNLREDMKNAATGTRGAIMKGAIDERKAMQGDIKEKREAFREEVKERKAAFKDRVKDAMQSRLGGMIERIKNATTSFDNLVTRIQSRIDKLKASGADTTSAETALATAAGLIATAKSDISALETLASSASQTASDSSSETVRSQIKAAVEKATKSIKAAHQALRDAAKTLAGITAPTTTQETTNPSN